jgi:hypothetical protein
MYKNNEDERVSDYFARACAKVRLAQEYVTLYEYYAPKKECLLYELSVMLGDALRELNTIAQAIPDERVQTRANR